MESKKEGAPAQGAGRAFQGSVPSTPLLRNGKPPFLSLARSDRACALAHSDTAKKNWRKYEI